jgi:hypothetical protein
LFSVTSLKHYPYVASSDFHKPKHLYSWKTVLRCERTGRPSSRHGGRTRTWRSHCSGMAGGARILPPEGGRNARARKILQRAAIAATSSRRTSFSTSPSRMEITR